VVVVDVTAGTSEVSTGAWRPRRGLRSGHGTQFKWLASSRTRGLTTACSWRARLDRLRAMPCAG